MNSRKISSGMHGKINEPIAIIGMSCRFPQVLTLADFWKLLYEGRDTVAEIPAERWDTADFYHPDPAAEHKTNQRHASMLKAIHDFDPFFFGISPAEAQQMSPSQKLMLELVWEAIENSSVHFEQFKGSKTGVYIGNIWNDFEHMRKQKNARVTSHSAMGQSANIIANRVSFIYGFTGPSLVVDTGCSSSLVALHLACQSLWDESTEMSVVAGVNHILDPDQYILLSKFGGLSAKGKCSTFSSDADGFVRGEGGGVVLLKKLSDAQKNGDKIYALIRGTAMNNNGFNVSLPATSVTGQKQMLADAYAKSGITPAEVHYVEAHGTGTRLGDPTETQALGEFFCAERTGPKLHIGSVKTNIGHLEAAAGIASLIKVVLAIQHQALPRSLNYTMPNPKIPFENLKLSVQEKPGPWPTVNGETLKAGVNSFGWGGTNAHTVIEEYRPSHDLTNQLHKKSQFCLPLSAKSPDALKDYIQLYADRIDQATPEAAQDICVASALLKPSFAYRAFFTASNKEEMHTALMDFLAQGPVNADKILTGNEKIVMVFPGQGAQWHGMGKTLFHCEPLFRQLIESTDQAFKPYVTWSLIEQLLAPPEKSRLDEIDVVQPVLFAIQIALAKLWISWGLQPHALVGHSMGEVAAAFVSGALDLDTAACIICNRSSLMKTVSGKGGTMALTELSVKDAEALLIRYPQCSLAANNSPKSTVLAGDQKVISQVLEEIQSQGLFCRQVNVDVASHSPQMDSLKHQLGNMLHHIEPRATTIPLYSTVRNEIIDGQKLTADYWVENLRKPVRFAETVNSLLNNDHTIFVEISPHPILSVAVNECAGHINKKVISIGSLHREQREPEFLYKRLGELFEHGYPVNWKGFYGQEKSPHTLLPGYPFQREAYVLESRAHTVAPRKGKSNSPWIGNVIPLADFEGISFWEIHISLDAYPFLKDHQVNETIVLPGTVYIEMALEAFGQLFEDAIPAISNLEFIQAVNLPSEEEVTIQLTITKKEKSHRFGFYRMTSDQPKKTGWELVAQGEIKTSFQLQHFPECCMSIQNPGVLSGKIFYELLRSLGLNYGPYFQGIKQLKKWHGSLEVGFTFTPPDGIQHLSLQNKIHPAVLDACLQPLFFSLLGENTDHSSRTTFLTGIKEFHMTESPLPGEDLNGTAVLYPVIRDEQSCFNEVEADVYIHSTAGKPLITIRGLKGKIIDNSAIESRKTKLKNWLYETTWKKSGRLTPAHPVEYENHGTWIIFGDPNGISQLLLEKMQQRNLNCIHVIPGESFRKIRENEYVISFGRKDDYQKLINELIASEHAITGIIHMAAVDISNEDLTADSIEASQIYGSISLLYLYQQLLKLARISRLVVMTNGVQAIHQQEVTRLVHSPLWGIAKVMMNESSQFPQQYIDLSDNPSGEELDLALMEIGRFDESENEVAFRDNNRYVPRLQKVSGKSISQSSAAGKFSDSGTYVITGYRGIAFDFVEWMEQRGACHFALINRTGETPPNIHARILAMRSRGCTIKLFSADAGHFDELEKVFKEIEISMPAIIGVVHAAGLIKANRMSDISSQELLHILHPKVRGAWNLHLLTLNKSLDCFILFSSASTLIGLSGQASYVAANGFLDALAHHRAALGLPAISVNWGVISDCGMAADNPELKRYASAEGFHPVPMTSALDVFNAVYKNGFIQMGIVKLNVTTMAAYYPTLAGKEYFKGLLEKHIPEQRPEQEQCKDDIFLLGSSSDKIAALENLIIEQVAEVIKTPPARLKPSMTFKGMGIDSIMAIQLRNAFEKRLDLKLSVGMFWTYPSLTEYAVYLKNLLEEKNTTGVLSESEPAQEWAHLSKPNPHVEFRLLCFHDAGGDSTLFSGWKELLGDKIEVIALELPGRGKRVKETLPSSIKELVEDLKEMILPFLDKPYACIGHSMGGLLAFEIARSLRKNIQRQPSFIVLSSVPALDSYSMMDIDFSSLAKDLLNNKIIESSLKESILELLKKDLALLQHYQYVPDTPLQTNLLVIHGMEDPRVKNSQAEKWGAETLSSCTVIARPGGHRYIEQDGRFLTSLILRELNKTKSKPAAIFSGKYTRVTT